MKLLSKLNRRYALWTLFIMIMSAFAMYLIISVVMSRQTDEQLTNQLHSVLQQQKKTQVEIDLAPMISILKTKTETELSPQFSDTLIFSQAENEMEEFRQISMITNIGDSYYHIAVRQSKIESADLLATLLAITALALLILWISLVIINLRVVGSVWQPFFINLDRIKKFSIMSDQSLALDQTGIFEFDQLSQVVTELTEHIITDFQNQKRFNEDISHELQTPLAIISSHLENLIEEEGLNENQANKIYKVIRSVNRLSRLNNNLILLSKIENNQFTQCEKTNLTQIFEEKTKEFKELIELKKITPVIETESHFWIEISAVLAEILANNLVSNSINHNLVGGRISITSSADQLLIGNTGTDRIENPDKLFHRFFKADQGSNSVGLGLAIVKKICENHKITLTYDFSAGQHLFILTRNPSHLKIS